MIILHIISGLDAAGAEFSLYNLLNNGLNNHFKNYVISLNETGVIGPLIQEAGIPVIALDLRKNYFPFNSFKKLYKIIKTIKPDIIQGWMYHGNLAASFTHFLLKKNPALIWNVRHSLYNIRNEKQIMRQIILGNRIFSSSPDSIIYNSKVSNRQHELFGFSSKNSMVIPNGIDIHRFSFSYKAYCSIRNQLKIPFDSFVVGHIARFHPMKNHHQFLNAAVNLSLNHPNIHFILCGRDISLKNNKLRKLIPNEVLSRFHLLGERLDTPNLYSAMDAFCLSSSWGEGFPNVLGEAMATGLVCISTEIGDSADILGDAGIIIQPSNTQKLEAAIELVIKMPIDRRRSIGMIARNRIISNYSITKAVNLYTMLYKQKNDIKKGSQ